MFCLSILKSLQVVKKIKLPITAKNNYLDLIKPGVLISRNTFHFWTLFQVPRTLDFFGLWNFHHDLMTILFFILGFVIAILHFLSSDFLWFAGKKKKEDYLTRFTGNSTFYLPIVSRVNWLEIIWTVAPTLILLTVLLPSLGLIYALENLVPCLITLKIIGHQWYWNYEINFEMEPMNFFEFSDFFSFQKVQLKYDSYILEGKDTKWGLRTLEVDKHVLLPIRTNTRLLITSADVIHSWALPCFGLKVDACPGRLNFAVLNSFWAGYFWGQCSELCGVNHGFMPIGVKVVTWGKWFSWFFAMHFSNRLINTFN